MKKFNAYVVIILLTVLIIPSVALASWWNPFSWHWYNIFNIFSKPQTSVVQPVYQNDGQNQSQNHRQQTENSSNVNLKNLDNTLLNNTKYSYQFYYNPKVFKVALVGTKIEPTDYREVHIDAITPSNPGNPVETCYGGNYVSEQDFYLINTSSTATSNLSNQFGLSVIKTVKVGQQNRALNPGEVNNSTLRVISYNISNESQSFDIAFGCQGSLISNQDRIKYGFMSKAQDDIWLKTVEDKLDQTISTFKFTN